MKIKEWNNLRRKLKLLFEKWDTTSCELGLDGCWKDHALGFAHAKKRRHLKTNEYQSVALLCNPCHNVIEELPEHEMEEIIIGLIMLSGNKERIEWMLGHT
jgi:hypothetical protein